MTTYKNISYKDKNTAETTFLHIGLVSIFLLAALASIKNIYREDAVPYIDYLLLSFILLFITLKLILYGIKTVEIKSKFFILANTFGLYALITAILSENPLLSALRNAQYLITINGLYFLSAGLFLKKEKMESIGKIIIYFCLISCAYGIILHIFVDIINLNYITIVILDIYRVMFI